MALNKFNFSGVDINLIRRDIRVGDEIECHKHDGQRYHHLISSEEELAALLEYVVNERIKLDVPPGGILR